ncbi:MAG: TrkA family potassium uptake protein [Butyricicoccus pullicaecorum]|nr:TrkA family potassium uptake protein [Butyricicoccus pullicaecorum]MDO4668716.1 TrkA family potassium uptake protein [Butyricicoccus pullicaecorum]
MSFFETEKKDDYVIIVGCGRLGASLANTLSDNNGNVLIMDTDSASFRRLSSHFGGLSMSGDGMDLNDLKAAQIDKASAVIAVTNHDNTNIMVAQLARDLFHVNKVIARLYDPERESVYQELGIETICPAVLSAKEVDKFLGREEKHLCTH